MKLNTEELILFLEMHKDFSVEFCFTDGHGEKGFPNIRRFNNITVTDVGHSDKVITLTGDEY